MNTSKTTGWKKQGRSVQGRTHAEDNTETACRELLAHDQPIKLFHKGRWSVDSLKGTTVLMSPKNHTIFSQGGVADAVFYIHAGRIKQTVVSSEGKEAVVAILESGAFFGESCLGGRPVRTATATAIEDSTLVRLDKAAMIRGLHEEPAFAELFMSYLLARTIRIQEDVVDQLFNSGEKRLARILLLLAHVEDDGKLTMVIPRFSAETFAEMIGTTRSRVSFFMNRFRKLGYIDYNSHNSELHVRSSLRNIILHD